jgi:hypothetical protein
VRKWKGRSVPAGWKKLVDDRVLQRVVERRAGAARDSLSLARYIRRNPEFKAPVANRWSDNPQGQWLKRRLRTDSLPLLEVIWRGARKAPSRSEEKKRTECVNCGEGPEDERHFLDCQGFRSYRQAMLRECEEAMAEAGASDRSAVMYVLRGVDREAAHDLMMGATHMRMRVGRGGARDRDDGGDSDSDRVSKEAMKAVHGAVCRYLVKCWRKRAEWYGGVPRRRVGGCTALDVDVEPDIWESLRCVRHGSGSG